MNIREFIETWCKPKQNNNKYFTSQECIDAWKLEKRADPSEDEKRMIRNSIRGSISDQSFETGDKLMNILKANELQEYYPSADEGTISVESVYDTIINKEGEFRDFSELKQIITDRFAKNIAYNYKEQSALLTQINTQLGMSGQLSADFRDEITEASPDLIRMRISFSEMASHVTQLVADTGRFRLINQETIMQSGALAKAYVGSLSELASMYPTFEKIGMGVSDTSTALIKAGQQAMGLGLRSQTVTKEIGANISKLNEFGFKNGVEGLSKMVRQSIEFRMNMENVFKIAEDVMDPEKALSLTANLQAIGGSIGAFNDPMKLMYMATNNVEGISDALKEAASSLATYNSEQGRFEITGVNLRRARAMASELGIAMGDLTKMAIASSERMSANTDLLARGLTLTDEQREFITNISQMKGGRMVVELNSEKLKKDLNVEGNYLALENLTSKQAETLVAYQEDLKKKTTDDVIRGQATNVENMKGNLNFLAQLARIRAGKTGDALYTQFADTVSKALKGDKVDMDDLNKNFRDWAKEQKNTSRGMTSDIVKDTEDFKKQGGEIIRSGIDKVTTFVKPDEQNKDKNATNNKPIDNKTETNVVPIEKKDNAVLLGAPLKKFYNKSPKLEEGNLANNQTNNKMMTVVRHEFSFASSYLDDFSRSLIKDPTIAFKFRDTFIEDKRGYLS